MKKTFVYCLATIAMMAFLSASIFATEEAKKDDSKAGTKAGCAATCAMSKVKGASGCAGMKEASATTTDGKAAGCAGMKEASATEASATMVSATTADGKTCTMSKEACAKMTKEECAKMCGGDKNCSMVSLSIKGMTCTGCEQSITAALEKIEGVRKVAAISYKEGTALVCTDAGKVKGEAIVSAISDKGYQAEVIPAVATTEVPAKGHVCSPENKAACGKK